MQDCVIVGYARVSTRSDEQAISIEAQVQQLAAAGCERVIQERASAYREDSRRPGWEELQALVASGRVSKVVAVSQSRLSRREDITGFLRICSRKRVEVQFLDGTPGDIADPAARLMTGVMATINEVDSQIKSINIKNGLQRRKAAGYYACGRVPFGYRYDGQHVVIHPEHFAEAQVLWQRLKDSEFNLGNTIRVHDYDWSVRGLRRWIQNPILRGIISTQSVPVEPLISLQDYADAMAIIGRRKETGTRTPRVRRLFSAFVRCCGCRRMMQYATVKTRLRLKCMSFRCSCYGRGIAEHRVRDQLIAALESCAEQLARAAATPPPVGPPTPEQQTLQRRLDALLAMQHDGQAGLEAAIRDLQQQMQAPAPSAPDWSGLAAVLARPGVLRLASDEELRPLLLEFVDEILYIGNPHTVEIRLRQCPGRNPP